MVPVTYRKIFSAGWSVGFFCIGLYSYNDEFCYLNSRIDSSLAGYPLIREIGESQGNFFYLFPLRAKSWNMVKLPEIREKSRNFLENSPSEMAVTFLSQHVMPSV